MDDFMKSFSDNNGHSLIHLSEDRSVHAKQDISTNEKVLVVPRNFLITDLDYSGNQELSNQDKIAILLLKHKKTPNSVFTKYINATTSKISIFK